MGQIQEKFEEFHWNNPDVYNRLVRLALDLSVKGHSRYGMKGLFEVLRWERAMTTTGSVFKLNNNYTALYARLIMRNVPKLRNFFQTREHSPQIVE